METLQSGSDVLFVLLGAILVLWMHAGFAFLEVGTVQHKNQVNALSNYPHLIASFVIVALIYPTFEGIVWNGNLGFQAWLRDANGFGFHDFAGSVVVHTVGGWLALGAVILLGARTGRYSADGRDAGTSALQHPLAGSRRMDTHSRLVWLQCHVSAGR